MKSYELKPIVKSRFDLDKDGNCDGWRYVAHGLGQRNTHYSGAYPLPEDCTRERLIHTTNDYNERIWLIQAK